MSRSTIRLAGALAASGLLAAVLGGSVLAQSPAAASMAPGSAAPGGPRVVALNVGATSIDPASVQVLKGETVTFNVTNVSPAEVELIMGLKTDVDADSGDSLKEAEHIAVGGTGSVTYTFDGAGPYAYGDQLPGHYAAGAKGDIVLVDALTK